MSDIVLTLEGVTKRFRRFRHPGLRALNALGVPVPARSYDTFTALDNVSLTIRKGEKVALIGRNGAGKTTLLRLISKQMQPDNGKVAVAGNIQALMELGTGFHPDFSGIQNIRSALAYQGIGGSKVARIEQEIIEFTELEEFIHRPVREYSAGMYARLAFAVATSIEPDILIIDEILGAGDAYFVGKCIQRMKELTSKGATILFVSHDMSAVQMLCDRGIWIERGKVRQDGDVLAISKAYAASVREEEEVRLRMRSMSLGRSTVARLLTEESATIFRFISTAGGVPKEAFLLCGINYMTDGSSPRMIDLAATTDLTRLIDEPGSTNWSRLTEWEGRTCRTFADHDGRYLHAPLQIDWRGMPLHKRQLEVSCRPSESDDIALDYYNAAEKRYDRIGVIPKGDTYQTFRFDVPDGTEPEAPPAPTVEELDLEPLTSLDRYGEGKVRISAFGFFDSEMVRRHTLISGEEAVAVMRFEASAPIADPVGVVAIYRPDGTCAMQVFSNRRDESLGTLERTGMLKARFSPLLLGPGDYIVSIALFKELPLRSASEPPAYELHDRCYALKVLPPDGIAVTIGTVNQPTTWDVIHDPAV